MALDERVRDLEGAVARLDVTIAHLLTCQAHLLAALEGSLQREPA